MVDRTTLPVTQAGEEISEGREFEVLGQNFSRWPNEIVLGYDETVVLTSPGPKYLLWLTEKSDTRLVFVAQSRFTVPAAHAWYLFANPFASPREMLAYERL